MKYLKFLEKYISVIHIAIGKKIVIQLKQYITIKYLKFLEKYMSVIRIGKKIVIQLKQYIG